MEQRGQVNERLADLRDQVQVIGSESRTQNAALSDKVDRVIERVSEVSQLVAVHAASPGHQAGAEQLTEFSLALGHHTAVLAEHAQAWALFHSIIRLTLGVAFTLAIVVLGAILQNTHWLPWVVP